ncbi:hypothetical protein GCM10023235_00800 [Kitasatospora terrestris]|uniref:Uncharacterized protein n=1 Tax=Kitasatospora terrestris TaxID=258051 RepID=A0ABP9D8Q6_9ACTN
MTAGGPDQRPARRATAAKEDLSRPAKAQLHEKTARYEIAHRSTVSRGELQEAVAKVGRVLDQPAGPLPGAGRHSGFGMPAG